MLAVQREWLRLAKPKTEQWRKTWCWVHWVDTAHKTPSQESKRNKRRTHQGNRSRLSVKSISQNDNATVEAVVICLRRTNGEKVHWFVHRTHILAGELKTIPVNYFNGTRRKGGSIVRIANWLVDGGEITIAVSTDLGTTTMQEYGTA